MSNVVEFAPDELDLKILKYLASVYPEGQTLEEIQEAVLPREEATGE